MRGEMPVLDEFARTSCDGTLCAPLANGFGLATLSWWDGDTEEGTST